MKWVCFLREKPILKYCHALEQKIFQWWNLDLSKEKLWMSVGLRATKLPSVKLWEWFSPSLTRTQAKCTLTVMAKPADFFLTPPNLMASNFAALSSTDPKFLALKDLLFFSQHIEFQDAGSILKVVFALSNWPHLHRAYSVTVCKRGATAVYFQYGKI